MNTQKLGLAIYDATNAPTQTLEIAKPIPFELAS